jgi:S-(hydroxymethyl)glutathione dehydrogenase/alcohol dehydrogenase
MSVRAKAAVCREMGRITVETIEIEAPRAGEVMIRLAACGVCHSDVSATNGTIPIPLPLVLGHEGAGIVEAIGEGVAGFAPGDHVLSSFVTMCGKCRMCQSGRPHLCVQSAKSMATLPDGTRRTHALDGTPLNVFCGCGVMAERATLHADNLVKIDPTMPLDKASLIACGVTTGFGAVANTAKVEAGSSVAVFGCGGVGLNVIQGARILGATTIVAVDRDKAKLELAERFGATHGIDTTETANPVKAIRALTGGGVDYAFECVGRGDLVALAHASLCRGGLAVAVGMPKGDDVTPIRTISLAYEEKRLTGSYYGAARPLVDFPRLISLYRGGRLLLDELITRTYGIEEAPRAIEDLIAGRNARGVIVF